MPLEVSRCSRYPPPIFFTLIATTQENYMHIIPQQNYTSHTFIKGVLAPPRDKESEESQVHTLLYSMGEEADDIVQSLGIQV